MARDDWGSFVIEDLIESKALYSGKMWVFGLAANMSGKIGKMRRRMNKRDFIFLVLCFVFYLSHSYCVFFFWRVGME